MTQQCGFSGAVAAHEGDALPGLDAEVDRAQDRAATVELVPDVVEAQRRLRRGAISAEETALGGGGLRRWRRGTVLRQQPVRAQRCACLLDAGGRRAEPRAL